MIIGAFYFQKDSLLLPESSIFPSNLELPPDYAENLPVSDVFTISTLAGGRVISCVLVSPEAILPQNVQPVPVRQVISQYSSYIADGSSQVAGMLRAYHVAQWRRDSMFCGSCGGKNADSPDELARLCPTCGRLEFPRITPAVITIITNDEGKALLAHNKKFAPGMYSLIAGFAEAGESLEAAVAREIREEVGLEIRDIRYVVSQTWPFPNALMVGFSARYASGEIKPDGKEIEDARWFGKDELPMLPGPGSVSRLLIDRWREN